MSKRLFVLAPALCILVSPAFAQTPIPVPVGLSFTGHGSTAFDSITNTFQVTMNGDGTLSPFGLSSVSINGPGENTSLPSYPSYQLTFVFSFGGGASLTASGVAAQPSQGVLTGTATVSAGTGTYAKSTGSFSFTLTATISNPYSFTVAGSGTIVTSASAGTGGGASGGSGLLCETGSGSTLPIARTDPRSTTTSTASTSTPASCKIIICDGGMGSTLPILNTERPTAGASEGDIRGLTTSATTATTSGSSCSSVNVVAYDGAGSSLPVLVYDGGGFMCETGGGSTLPNTTTNRPLMATTTSPATTGSVCETGAGGTLPILVFEGGGSTLPVLVFEGGGSTLPVLVFDGGGSTSPVIVAELGSGSTLPIARTPIGTPNGLLFDRSASEAAGAAVPKTHVLELLTPIQTAASTYSAAPSCSGSAVDSCWLTVASPTGTMAANSRAAITAVANPEGLNPGLYNASVIITITPTSGAGIPAVVSAPVRMLVPPSGPRLGLSQTGLSFQIAAGAGTPAAQSILVFNSGSQSVEFTATTSGEPWLTVSRPSAPVTPDAPVAVSVKANPTGLAPGIYTSRIDFAGTGAVNGTQSATVALTVLPPATSIGPTISATALVFVAAAGSNPAPQTLLLGNPSNGKLTISATTSLPSGMKWLNTFASGNTITAAQPLSQSVSANTAGLAPGVYPGLLTIHTAETNTDLPVEVLLIVHSAGACVPAHLYPVFTNLEGGFVRTAGLPVPLEVMVVDGCGNPLTSGAVSVYFPSTADTGVPLSPLGQGKWAGTWMPHSLAGGAVNVGVMASSVSAPIYGSAGVVGLLAANPNAPLITPGGVTNSASLAPSPVAPGSLISIAGTNLASGPDAAATDGSPYPNVLSGGTQVFLNGEAMPLVTSDAGSISAVVPYDVPAGVTQQLIVLYNGMYSPPQLVLVSAAAPGVFSVATPATPSTAGDSIVIYCAGLGAVNPAQLAGTPIADAQSASAVNPVTVTIGGQTAAVSFAGLSPVMIGWYEVDVTVPSGIEAGPSVPVVVTVAGLSSVPVTMAVR